jgi:hypothetical protein
MQKNGLAEDAAKDAETKVQRQPIPTTKRLMSIWIKRKKR